MVKPILKWVGGKQQIRDTLCAKFPTKLNNFRDIFVGGGSVLIRMLEEIKNRKTTLDGNIYAYDLNESLIYFYQNVQKNPDELRGLSYRMKLVKIIGCTFNHGAAP